MFLGYSNECKKVIDRAKGYAMSSGGLLGTEHLIAAMLKVEDCQAGQYLRNIGVDVERYMHTIGFQQANQSSYTLSRRVENILNNASKENRNKLNRVWDKISEKYANNFAIQILTNGKIIAASSDSFIVELQDVGFCNRVMSYENYQKIIEIFNDLNIDIKDYICLPKQVCAKILADYKKKYDPIDNPKPSLDEFNLGIKKRVSPVNVEVKKDEDEQNLIDLFDNNLKIMEE